MADCFNPSPKEAQLMATMSDSPAPDATAPAARRMSLLVMIWMGLLTAISIAAVIMAAWATDRARAYDNSPIQLAAAASGNMFLVSDPTTAASFGFVTLGNIHAGSGYWSNRSLTLSHPVSDNGVESYGGEIYVFGGASFNPANASEQFVSANMRKYNMYKNAEFPMPQMPEPRYRFGYAVLNDKLYVFGGFNEIEGDTTAPAGTTMIFDFLTGAWDPLDSTSPVMSFPRGDVGGSAANGKVYASGGYNQSASYTTVAYVEALDPTTGKWSRVTDMLGRRGDHRMVTVGSTLYVMGGIVSPDLTCMHDDWDLYYVCNPWTTSMESFDTTQPALGWKKMADMIRPRGDFAATVLSNGHILVAGGELNWTAAAGFSNSSSVNAVAQPFAERYITEHNIWVPKAPMFQPRFRFDMSSDDGNFVYAFGGAPTCDPNSKTDNCNQNVLSTIISFADIQYHNIWIAGKAGSA